LLFSQKPDLRSQEERSPAEVNLLQRINDPTCIDLLKGGFLDFLTETRFKVTRGEVTCRGKSATKDQWPNLH
jgi:hypothetical protein